MKTNMLTINVERELSFQIGWDQFWSSQDLFCDLANPHLKTFRCKSVVFPLDFLISDSIFVWNLKLNLLGKLEPFYGWTKHTLPVEIASIAF